MKIGKIEFRKKSKITYFNKFYFKLIHNHNSNNIYS